MSFNNLKILILHGPNLNLTGFREPNIYGKKTLEQINEEIQAYSQENKIEVRILQSNHEGVLIDTIQECRDWATGIILNGGALTHYSYALREACTSIRVPVIEVHLSNIYARESFRHCSVISPITIGQIVGFGSYGYLLALKAFQNIQSEMIS